MIKASHISKTFRIPHEKRHGLKDHFVNLFSRGGCNEFSALKGVTFSVESGEWLGIIGRNGSGKSTLLKILAGIYPHDSGSLDVRGNVAPFLELGVGFEPELSARDNVFLNGLLLGISRRHIAQQFDEIIGFAGVQSFVDQKLKNFSSGMKVRLAFAIAMHAPADIFLIDEVFSVGDHAFQEKSLSAFKEKFRGKTVVFVSHDMNIIRENCHRILWLSRGSLRAEGPDVAGIVTDYLNSKE